MEDPAYQKMVAYGVILLLLWAASKSGIGYRAIYWGSVVILVFLLISNAARVTSLLQPLIIPGANNG